MRRMMIALALFMFCSGAARGGESPLGLEILGGHVELVLRVFSDDGALVFEKVHGFEATSDGLDATLLQNFGGLELSAMLCVTPTTGGSCFGSLDVYTTIALAASATGYTATAHLTTAEPIRFRVLSSTLADLDEFGGSNGSLTLAGLDPPVQNRRLCPGTYELTFDAQASLASSQEYSESIVYGSLSLKCTDSGVRLTGGGDVFTSGFFEDPEGDGDSSSFEGDLYEGGFNTSGDTSGGLADGYSSMSGSLESSCGETQLNVSGYARASQPAGHGWSLFVGSQAEQVELEIDEERAYYVTSPTGHHLEITAVTGGITGNRLAPGIYQLSFSTSAFIGPLETEDREDIELTLTLYNPPCNAADIAYPSGVLDFDDVLAFAVAFGERAPEADLALPTGEFNFDDILAFLSAFGTGCP
ncbi:MAG: GC-type dockerin domain-anchored protein [Phycisphaerales bacterium JB059]